MLNVHASSLSSMVGKWQLSFFYKRVNCLLLQLHRLCPSRRLRRLHFHAYGIRP